MLVTLAFERQRQEDQEFKTNLVHVAGFKGSMDYMIPFLKKNFFSVWKLCVHSRVLGAFPSLRVFHSKQTPCTHLILVCGITSSAITLRCLRACQFLSTASRSSLGQVMRHPFSLGTPISVSVLLSIPAVYHLSHLRLTSVSMVCCVIKAQPCPRISWYLMDGKKQPLPDLKNPGISAVVTDKQVGESKTCSMRGISRCRVKMFEDRWPWCVLSYSKFFLFVEVPVLASGLWCHVSLQSHSWYQFPSILMDSHLGPRLG